MKNTAYIKSFFVFIICLLSVLGLFAQDEANNKINFGIETSTSLSYSGFNQNLSAIIAYKKNEIIVGPKLSLSDFYIPDNGPFGFTLDYKRNLLNKQKLASFVNLNYQIVFIEPYNPFDVEPEGFNDISEIHLAYGLQYNFYDNIWAGNMIGIGKYYEKYEDLMERTTRRYSGYSLLVKVYLNYRF